MTHSDGPVAGYTKSEIRDIANDTVQWERTCDYLYDDCCIDNGTYSLPPCNETFYIISYNYSSPYLMPWPQRTCWIVAFSLMLIVATIGNVLVAWIVFGTHASQQS